MGKEKYKYCNNGKGITLIVLVITVIVLLILARSDNKRIDTVKMAY